MILSGNFLFLFLRYIFFPFFTVVSHSEIAHFHLLFPTSSLPPWTELNNACARLHDVMWLARLVGDQLTINVFFFSLSLFVPAFGLRRLLYVYTYVFFPWFPILDISFVYVCRQSIRISGPRTWGFLQFSPVLPPGPLCRSTGPRESENLVRFFGLVSSWLCSSLFCFLNTELLNKTKEIENGAELVEERFQIG